MVVPLFLPRENWSFDSGKNNGVVCADVSCNAAPVSVQELKPICILKMTLIPIRKFDEKETYN